MDLKSIMLGETCQRGKTIPRFHLYVGSRKQTKMKTKADSEREQTGACQRGRRKRDE